MVESRDGHGWDAFSRQGQEFLYEGKGWIQYSENVSELLVDHHVIDSNHVEAAVLPEAEN